MKASTKTEALATVQAALEKANSSRMSVERRKKTSAAEITLFLSVRDATEHACVAELTAAAKPTQTATLSLFRAELDHAE